MEHVLTMSFSLSDDDIIREVKERATKKAVEDLEESINETVSEVEKNLGVGKRGLYGFEDHVSAIAKEVADIVINKHLDGIVDDVVASISKRLPSRKAFCQAVSNGVIAKVFEESIKDEPIVISDNRVKDALANDIIFVDEHEGVAAVNVNHVWCEMSEFTYDEFDALSEDEKATEICNTLNDYDQDMIVEFSRFFDGAKVIR